MKTKAAWWVLVGLTVAPLHVAGADPLWDAQVRAGYGVAVDAQHGAASSTTPSPLSLEVLGTIAVNEDPPVSVMGGMVAETMRRGDVGVMGGVELKPKGTPFRFDAGGSWIYAPKTLWGAKASAGACKKVSPTLGMCGDVELTVYLAGDGLAMGHEITQVQFQLGFTIGGTP